MKYTVIFALLVLAGCGVLERVEEGSDKASNTALDAAENTLCNPVLGSTREEIDARYSEDQKQAIEAFCADVDDG